MDMLNNDTMRHIVSNLGGSSLLKFAQAYDGNEIVETTVTEQLEQALFMHLDRERMDIDSNIFLHVDHDQDSLRLELLHSLSRRFPVEGSNFASEQFDNLVTAVAEFLTIDVEVQSGYLYAKYMSMFLVTLFHRMDDLCQGFFCVDLLLSLSSFGFAALPNVTTLPCMYQGRLDGTSFYEYPMTPLDVLSNNYPETPVISCYNSRTFDLPQRKGDFINEVKSKVAGVLLNQDTLSVITNLVCDEETTWSDQQNELYHEIGSANDARDAAQLRVEKYLQQLNVFFDAMSEKDAGLDEPSFQLSPIEFASVFQATMNNTDSMFWNDRGNIRPDASSRSTMNILQLVVESIHFGRLWKLPLNRQPPLPEDLTWDGVFLLGEDMMSVLTSLAIFPSDDEPMDVDEGSEYEESDDEDSAQDECSVESACPIRVER